MTGYTVYIYRYNIHCTPFVCIPLHALYMRHMAYFLAHTTDIHKIDRKTDVPILGEPDTSRRIEKKWFPAVSECANTQWQLSFPQKLHFINGLWLTQSLASRDGYRISLNLLQLGLWVHVPNVSGCCREWQWCVRWETYSNEKKRQLGHGSTTCDAINHAWHVKM